MRLGGARTTVKRTRMKNEDKTERTLAVCKQEFEELPKE